MTISDDRSEDYVEKTRADGSVERVLDAEHVQRSRLRVDLRKWATAKAAPRRYGDKVDLNHSGGVTLDSRPNLSGLTPMEREVLKELNLKILSTMKAEDGVA